MDQVKLMYIIIIVISAIGISYTYWSEYRRKHHQSHRR